MKRYQCSKLLIGTTVLLLPLFSQVVLAHNVCDTDNTEKNGTQKTEKNKNDTTNSKKKIWRNPYEKKIMEEGGFDFFNEKPDAETCRWMGGKDC